MSKAIRTFLHLSLFLLIASTNVVNAESAQSQASPADEKVLKVRVVSEVNRNLRQTIQWQILNLALQKSGREYDLDVSEHIRAPWRIAKQMQTLGDEANIIWSGATPRRENEMRAVPIPLMQGLLSYWHIFVPEKNLQKFAHIKTVDDLKQYSILQGARFQSTPILEAEGFEVRYGDLPNFPKMVTHGRADMFMFPAMLSQSLNRRYKAAQLGVVPLPDAMLHFPMDHYFFLARTGSDELYDALLTGMKTAINDGSYNNLLRTHPLSSETYDKIMNDDFIQLTLNNPNLTDDTRKKLEAYSSELRQ